MFELIKKYEGLRLEAYRCPAGRWTIGYGHTADVHQGDKISKAQADMLLRQDAAALTALIYSRAKQGGVILSASQATALTSFAYNVGTEALWRSTLWRKLLEHCSPEEVAAEFHRWVYAAGKKLPGLVARREEEARIFLS